MVDTFYINLTYSELLNFCPIDNLLFLSHLRNLVKCASPSKLPTNISFCSQKGEKVLQYGRNLVTIANITPTGDIYVTGANGDTYGARLGDLSHLVNY